MIRYLSKSSLRALGWSFSLGALALAGCTSPLHQSIEDRIREELLSTHQRYQQQVAAGPVIELSREQSDVEKKLADNPERLKEIDEMSGYETYTGQDLQLGQDLMGQSDNTMVAMSLRKAVRTAVKNNLDVRQARMIPAINQTLVTQAEAVFDAVFFTNLDYNTLDTPQPPVIGGLSSAFGSTQTTTTDLTTGIRKPLTTGGQITAQTQFTRTERKPPFYTLNPYYSANFSLGITQPLLRNFGDDVNRAAIVLNESRRQQSLEDLHNTLLTIALNTERAYWTLVQARVQLQIQLKLLERTKKDRDQIEQRMPFDATQAQLTQANSFVESTRANVIRARQNVRVASDNLKQLVNDPDLHVASEKLILPVDMPSDLPVSFSLLDAVTQALRNRPDLRQALLQIKDTSIRQRVADNLRLPKLDLAATARVNGVGKNLDDAYDGVVDSNFVDFLVGLQFEAPIGNRAAEGLYQQRVLERKASVIVYQNQAQKAVVEVKTAMRQLITTYELIGATRAARRAAADNLRALQAQEDAGQALSPEFVDRKLQAESRLADAEQQEFQALVDYSVAITTVQRTMGTLLTYNGIEFSREPVGE
ncbi:MAG: hypothetical protein GC164_05160 [Phycisphaera sp.]|nr:hypothetical protein [Phycisphaera sp.]